MDFSVASIIAIGGTAVLCGLAFVTLLIRSDLAPASGLHGTRRWLLASGLGLGIFALSIKLMVIALLVHFKPRHPDLTAPHIRMTTVVSAQIHETLRLPVLWQALPTFAPSPPDNPTTIEKTILGRQLFFDRNLSFDGTVSCASCHDLALGGADKSPVSQGVRGRNGERNAPSVYNAAFQKRLFWDGRARTLEQQASGPLMNPLEMAMPDADSVVARVRSDRSYEPLFIAAFGDALVTMTRVAQAIAAFERTLITPDSAYDRFVNGDRNALNSAQLRGMALFQSIGCIDCHTGPNFSDASIFSAGAGLHLFPANENTLIDRFSLREDKGASSGGRGLFRVPSLRNVELTAPYFHNGSVDNLHDAVRIMAVSQRNAVLAEDRRAGQLLSWDNATGRISVQERKVLTSADVDDLVMFLKALTSSQLKANRSVSP